MVDRSGFDLLEMVRVEREALDVEISRLRHQAARLSRVLSGARERRRLTGAGLPTDEYHDLQDSLREVQDQITGKLSEARRLNDERGRLLSAIGYKRDPIVDEIARQLRHDNPGLYDRYHAAARLVVAEASRRNGEDRVATAR